MLFPTVEYALFFLVAFAASWALAPRLVAHKAFLLVASYAFYGFWDWRFLPVLVGLSLLAGLVAQALEPERAPRGRSLLLAAGVTAALGVLAVFKYLGFAAAAAVSLLELLGARPGPVPLPELALPVGISFFAFHAISLMVDAWRRRIAVPVRLLDALLYVAFFPQLVAGPILRASTFLPLLTQRRDPRHIDAAPGLQRIAVGLAKKVLLAQPLATLLVDPVFEAPAAHSGLEVLLAVYGYAGQIYCDFSGYTDVAIGSALLLGYQFPQNFDAPYRAQSPQDFWRRWHISLSTWLRDYLFIPLGGSRGTGARTAFALGATMVLGGLWHGAAWTFVAWGAFHGAWLIVHRGWAGLEAVRGLRATRAWRVVATVLTFHAVCLGWVLFRAQTFSGALDVLRALARGAEGPPVAPAAILLVAVALGAQWLPAALEARVGARLARLPLAVQGAAFAFALMLLDAFGPRGIAPFIYFRF